MPNVPAPVRIMIVDDHPLFLDGLTMILKDEKSIQIVGTASRGDECLEKMNQLKPEVILLDVHLPVLNGIDITRDIVGKKLPIRILALSSDEESRAVKDMMAAGGDGYILKSASKAEIMEAIHKVRGGEKFLPQHLLLKVLNNINPETEALAQKNYDSDNMVKNFSTREMEILQLIAEELTVKEIASQLKISSVTVVTHKKSMMLKCNVKNTAGLLRFAYDNNLLEHRQ